MSEVMLQQTQAVRVAAAFTPFVRTFPSLRSLAAATRADVLRAWSGLGYNRRAVNLRAAARIIVERHAGRIPSDVATLRGLPGVGPYTASAVASLAFGEPVAVLDTNVRRVLSRAVFGEDAGETPRSDVAAVADRLLDPREPAEWNQALMDLGREVCRPEPRCGVCPLAGRCAFRGSPRASVRSPKRQPAFVGSSREARGKVVRTLVERGSLTVAELVRATGIEPARVTDAMTALAADGILVHSKGRVRLAD